MNTIREQIIEKIDKVPEPILVKILKLVNSSAENIQNTKDDPILSVAGILSGTSISSKEIDNKLYGVPEN